MTLPGLESVDADRSSITLADHVDAICEGLASAGHPVVLAVHSGAGTPGYAVTDRMPENIATMIYVDTGAATGALNPDFAEVEMPLPSPQELEEGENLDGLTDEHLEMFRARAVPEPGAALRDAPELGNEARLDVPTTVICTGNTSEQYREWVEEGYSFVAGLAELRHVTYVDLPTSHWPMWSRPEELAAIIGDIAKSSSPG